MNQLYLDLKAKARGTRNRDVRIKLELFLLVIKLGNVSEACSRRGFSRTFYYKWWLRFKKAKFDLKALKEVSRQPKTNPKRLSPAIEKRIRFYQLKDYGARMIYAFLKREGIQVSRSTISHVLRRRLKHCSLKPRQRLKAHRKRYELPIPGQRIQLDVKYVPQLIEGRKAYAYVAIDECTRWRFAKAYHYLDAGTTVCFLNDLVKHCPFPIKTIQTDNGQEFTYKLNPIARHLEHQVDTWCRQNRITHRLIPPGVKELNGKVERSHRIDEYYFYWSAPTGNLYQLNSALKKWIKHYNEERPHGGLGFITPLEKLQERLKTLQQPLDIHEDLNLTRMRLTFLKETPMRIEEIDRQLNNLEKELIALLKVQSWAELSDQEKDARSQKAKQQWDSMSDNHKIHMQKLAIDAVRKSSKEGSKLEKFILNGLLANGYKVDFHKEQLLSNTKLQLDIFLPQHNIAIEIDGPSHFEPVWGDDVLARNQDYDQKKTGLLVGKGIKLIRVKQEHGFSNTRSQILLDKVLFTIKSMITDSGITFKEIGD